MTLEGARLLELHRSVSVESGMSHHDENQTTVSHGCQFMTKQEQVQVYAGVFPEIYEQMPDDIVPSSMSK